MTLERFHRPVSRRLDRVDRVVLCALLGTSFITACLVVRSPRVPGRWKDDGIYLVTARALARGEGYRLSHLPGEPHQTKYPVLYPFALSLVWRGFPDFPSNLPYMQGLNALFAAAAAWIAYRALRKAHLFPDWIAGWGAVLTVANPWWVQMVRFTMAEHLYALLSWTVLLFLVQAGGSLPAVHRRSNETIIAACLGALAVAAALTRSIGISLVAALVVTLLIRRRWVSAILSVLIIVLALGSWTLWRQHAALLNEALPHAGHFAYDLDYGHWLVRDLNSLARVMFHNISALAYGVFNMVAVPSPNWILQGFRGGFPAACPVYLGILLVAVLLVVGLLPIAPKRLNVIHLYLAFYLGLVWIWPFQPNRFLIPLLPVILPSFLLGVVRALSLAKRLCARWMGPSRLPPSHSGTTQPYRLSTDTIAHNLQTAVILAAGVMLFYYAFTDYSMSSSILDQAEYRQREARFDAMVRLVEGPAILVERNPAYFHLRTSRKVVPPFTPYDPVATLYPPHRKFRHCGIQIESAAPVRPLSTSKELLEYYAGSGLTHVLVSADRPQRSPIPTRVIESNVQRFVPSGSDGSFRIYEFRPAPLNDQE